MGLVGPFRRVRDGHYPRNPLTKTGTKRKGRLMETPAMLQRLRCAVALVMLGLGFLSAAYAQPGGEEPPMWLSSTMDV